MGKQDIHINDIEQTKLIIAISDILKQLIKFSDKTFKYPLNRSCKVFCINKKDELS